MACGYRGTTLGSLNIFSETKVFHVVAALQSYWGLCKDTDITQCHFFPEDPCHATWAECGGKAQGMFWDCCLSCVST